MTYINCETCSFRRKTHFMTISFCIRFQLRLSSLISNERCESYQESQQIVLQYNRHKVRKVSKKKGFFL